jgi:hypothetical protein
MTKKHSKNDPTVYEEGARAPKPGQSLRPDPIHTGDPADEPKQPYGLTETGMIEAQELGTTTVSSTKRNAET